jgi:hypothetical protein
MPVRLDRQLQQRQLLRSTFKRSKSFFPTIERANSLSSEAFADDPARILSHWQRHRRGEARAKVCANTTTGHDYHRRRGDHAAPYNRWLLSKDFLREKRRPLKNSPTSTSAGLIRAIETRFATIKAIQHRAAFGGIGKWGKH